MEKISYTASIHHDGSPRYVRRSSNAPACLGDDVTLRLRAGWEAPIERVLLRTCPDGEQRFTEMLLEDNPQPGCRWWQASLRLEMPVTSYRFLIFAEDGVWWYNGSGLHRYLPTDAEDFRILAGYAAPAWVRDSVFYQIFPDRFADGDPANNVHPGEYVYRGHTATSRPWGSPPVATGRASLVEFYGGDLQGIHQRLDYIQDLGANALYLNPIFTAYSNHRYDVVDYFHVDPHLGGDAALAELCQATAERGMRLILDIVPNHCGAEHPWFQAALADPAVETAEFFTFHHYPDDYEAWLGVRSLPKLNYRSAALRKKMYAGPDSVFRHWMRPPYSIDGWRLDVANMLARQGEHQLGEEVSREIRQAVKSTNPQAYLLGENFFDASDSLKGDMWDAVMNYSGFAKPLGYWLKRYQVHQHGQPEAVASAVPWPAEALAATWNGYRAAIPWELACQQFNLLGSHDTLRILELLDNNPDLNRLAVGVLMTYPGTPSVYYGDEVGLSGAGSTRACMPWDPAQWDLGLRQDYQKLIQLRRTSPALIDGGFQILLAESDLIFYLRDAQQEQILVIANRGQDQPVEGLRVAHGGIANGSQWTEIFSGQHSRVENGILPLAHIRAGIEIWRSV